MKNILTADEFLDSYIKKENIPWSPDVEKYYGAVNASMIEFTKLHVEAQKEAIKKDLETGLETFGISLVDDFKLEETGNCLIENAYPLENIK
jgi:hypothetical protein